MATTLDTLAEKLTEALGPNLVSVVLYGSAAAGDRQENFSDYNVLCVLNQITPAELGLTEPVFRWWKEKGNPSPLLLTENEFRTSSDCFAIEFSDIREHHKILYGKDVTSEILLDTSFYRAQVEHELRAKLIRLRQKASGILSDSSVLCQMLADSISTFCVLFRHALILHGSHVASKKREIVTVAAEKFGFDPDPLHRILAIREGAASAKAANPVNLLKGYLQAVGIVIDAVDVLEKGRN